MKGQTGESLELSRLKNRKASSQGAKGSDKVVGRWQQWEGLEVGQLNSRRLKGGVSGKTESKRSINMLSEHRNLFTME